jgi:outer membrane protein TolC
MKSAGLVGRKDAAWPPILVAAMFIAVLGSASSEAQTPSIMATTPPSPVEREKGRTASTAPPAGASTVSSVIERYVKASGRDVPTTASAVPSSASMFSRPRPTADPATTRTSQVLTTLSPVPHLAQEAGLSTARPNPLATNMILKPAPVEPTDRRFPINLATALRLSDARPLIVAAAQAGVWVAEAELTRTKVLWVPSLTLAADYLRHDGGGPDFNKGIMTAPSVNFFYAGPSLFQYVNLTDAIFEPLAARQMLNSKQWDVQSAKNDALQRTADAYFLVHQYRGIYAGALYAVGRGRDLVDRVKDLSKDMGTKVEVERSRNLLADLEQRAVSAREEWRVQSANLTQTLRLDPRAVVEPLEHDHAQITLIDPAKPLDDLMAIALTNRPELASRKALVEAAEVRVRREKARPLLPLVMLNGFQTSGGMMIQGGIFGLGPNSSLNQWVGRDDVSLQLVWQLEGLGIGNLAKVKNQRGQQSKSIIDLRKTQDMVAGDVTRAQARVQSAVARVLQADRALRTGLITFNGQIEGLGQTRRFGDVLVLTNKPQEAVYALKLLNTAFEEYFTTVAEYNRAQFELFHALGYPARELAGLKPVGDILPMDTSRPSFLPQVGNGPPPATR